MKPAFRYRSNAGFIFCTAHGTEVLTRKGDAVIEWRGENAMLAPIRIPETKPATELIDGRLVQKMSPKRRHQALERRWTDALDAWSGGRGEAYHEWRHEFTAPGHRFASLVPDVAYLSAEALEALGPAGSESPECAPEVAVEILSAGESQTRLAWKVGAYLAAGTKVVFVVDPPKRIVVAHAADGVTTFGPGDTVRHAAMPGFTFAIDTMFEGLYLG
jgi:Uma2 family endonuclease